MHVPTHGDFVTSSRSVVGGGDGGDSDIVGATATAAVAAAVGAIANDGKLRWRFYGREEALRRDVTHTCCGVLFVTMSEQKTENAVSSRAFQPVSSIM